MKKIKIESPKAQTTLPRHEQAARRARAKAGRPTVSRKSRRSTAAPAHPDVHTNPLLFGQ